MLRRVALVETGVSEECSAFIIRVTRIGELGTTIAVTSNGHTLQRNTILSTLIMEAIRFSEKPVLTRITLSNIPEDRILHSHRCENLKSYIPLTGWTL
jgi:hypothetical protein